MDANGVDTQVKILFLDILNHPKVSFLQDYKETIAAVQELSVTVEFQQPLATHNGRICLHGVDEKYDGIIVSGSVTPFCSSDSWVRDLSEYMRDWHRADRVPVLGICMAHQLIGATFGGAVKQTLPKELGTVEIFKTHDGSMSPLFFGMPEKLEMLAAHSRDVIELPPGAINLAWNKRGPCQALQLGNLFGVQFHAEVSAAAMKRWLRTREGAADLVTQGFIKKPCELKEYLRNEVRECPHRFQLFRNFFELAKEYKRRRFAPNAIFQEGNEWDDNKQLWPRKTHR